MLQPYRLPVFNSLARHPDLDFHVLLLSWREKNRQWTIDEDRIQFPFEVLPHKEVYIRALDWGLHFNTGIKRALDRLAPDVIAGTGYVSPAYVQAQRYARKRGLGYVLWSGSTEATSRIGKGPIRIMKEAFVRRCDASLAYGTAAARMLMQLGASKDRVVVGTNTVDVAAFARDVAAARQESGYDSWRGRFPKRNVFFVGQMIERKGAPSLIRAFAAANRPDLGLILIGDGPRFEDYRREFASVPNLFWEGYRQYKEIVHYYAASHVLVMPSEIEVWGLVVNEAMASGLPVIATSCSGATQDLVRNGETGYSYTSGDETTLSEYLGSVADEPEKWDRMARNASTFIQQYNPDKYADDFARAVKIAHAARGGNR